VTRQDKFSGFIVSRSFPQRRKRRKLCNDELDLMGAETFWIRRMMKLRVREDGSNLESFRHDRSLRRIEQAKGIHNGGGMPVESETVECSKGRERKGKIPDEENFWTI